MTTYELESSLISQNHYAVEVKSLLMEEMRVGYPLNTRGCQAFATSAVV